MDKQQAQLLREIQKHDFMVTELNLFLDTHPCDRQAIAEFNQHSQHVAMLRNQYEQLYGPLTLHERCGPVQYPWRWVEEPWPWQI